jgi:hypothetical protein
MTSREELAVAYAEAMWQWARVEHEAFYIYLAAVGKARDDYRTLQAAYLSLTLTEHRLRMMRAAASSAWSGTILEDFQAIESALTKGNKTRNKIAHLTAADGNPRLILPPPKGDDPSAASKFAGQNWTAQKLRSLAAEWSNLQRQIDAFVRERFLAQQAPSSRPGG